MPRIQVTVSKKMDRILKRRSQETNVPISALIREAIVEWAQRRDIDLEDDVIWGGGRTSQMPADSEEGQPVAVAVR